MKIQVWQTHIETAHYKLGTKLIWNNTLHRNINSKCCPIALAVKDMLPSKIVYASQARITICDINDKEECSIKTPQEVAIWISNFDCCRPVAPFSFELDYEPLA